MKIRQIKRNVALVFGFFIYISAVSPGRLLVFALVKGMFVWSGPICTCCWCCINA